MTTAALLCLHRETILPEWIDYNGHMNEAYYMVVFSHATDAFMDEIGLDDATRRRTGLSLYTLQNHVSYLRDVGLGKEVYVTTQLLDWDTKRAHIYHAMYDGTDDGLLAECETMQLHVDTNGPKSAPFAPEVAARLEAIFESQRDLPRPERAGRSIGIRR